MSRVVVEDVPTATAGSIREAWRFAGLVVLAVGLLQAAWILVLPPFGGMDEFDHSYRASAVAHGQPVQGPFAAHGRGRLVWADKDLIRAAGPRCRTLKYVGPDNCRPVGAPRNGLVRIASSASSYNVPYYAVVGAAGRAFSGTGSLYAMRIASALLSLLMIGAGAWCLGLRHRGAWRGTGLFLALTPVAVYSTAIVAPNGPEIAAGVLLWAALLALGERLAVGHERAVLVAGGVAATVLADLRNLGPAFVVLTIVVAVLVAPGRTRALVTRHRALLTGVGVVVLVSLAQQLWWNHLMNQMRGAPVVPDVTVPWSGSLPIAWELGTIAVFPYRDQPAPFFVYIVYLVAFGALWIGAVRQAQRRVRAGLLLLSLGVLVMPFVLTVASYRTLGVIWQGRYGLALAVGVPLLAAAVLDARRVPLSRWAAVALGVMLTFVDLVCVLHVRTLELTRPVSASDPGAPTRTALLLVVVVLVAGAVRLVALLGPRRTEPK